MIFLLLLALSQLATSCSHVCIEGYEKDDSKDLNPKHGKHHTFCGRTMEQLTPFDYLVEGTPRHKEELADFPLCANSDGNGGWKGKWNYISVNIDVAPCKTYVPDATRPHTILDDVCTKYPEWVGKGTTWAADGINEHGLAVSMLAFMQRRFTSQEYDPELAKKKKYQYVCYMDFVAYALSMYKNIDEMILDMERDEFIMLDIAVDEKYKPLGETTHWSVQDATGRNVVVEYNVHKPGKPIFYENTVGILTNNPDFQWHMTNLNNYVGLSGIHEGGHSAEWKHVFGAVDKSHENPVQDSGYDMIGAKLGVGTNFMGIPGDFSPPSRFVRLYYLKQLAVHQVTPTLVPGKPDYAVPFVEQLIASVTIPRGTIPIEVEGLPSYTQWTVIKVPKERKFYWKGYTDHRLKMIDLTKLKTKDYERDFHYVIEDWDSHEINMTPKFKGKNEDSLSLLERLLSKTESNDRTTDTDSEENAFYRV